MEKEPAAPKQAPAEKPASGRPAPSLEQQVRKETASFNFNTLINGVSTLKEAEAERAPEPVSQAKPGVNRTLVAGVVALAGLIALAAWLLSRR